MTQDQVYYKIVTWKIGGTYAGSGGSLKVITRSRSLGSMTSQPVCSSSMGERMDYRKASVLRARCVLLEFWVWDGFKVMLGGGPEWCN